MIAALRRRFPRLVASPAVRISMGMSSLIVAILLAMDLAFGLLPDHTLLVRKTRERIAENLAIEAASLMGSGDVLRLGLAFREQVARDAVLGTVHHALHDLYRMEAARELLVVDLESCVRCGA